MPEIQPNKLSDLTAQAADLFKKAANKVKELKPEIPTTGTVAKELENVPKVDLVKEPPKDVVSFSSMAEDGTEHYHFIPGEHDKPASHYLAQTTIHTLPTGIGKTQIEKILGNEPIKDLVTEDISTMMITPADKAKLLKEVADAEKKYNPKITTVVGDEAFPPPPPEVNNFL